MKADLHIHTYASDGALSPEEVVKIALSGGVNLIAVTDHDTSYFSSEVKNLCAASGVKAVNGIEISAYDGDTKIHTLGYNFDPNNEKFHCFGGLLYENSFKRAEIIVKKLNAFGVKMTLDEAAAMRKIAETPVHGMHIARCGAEKGYAPTPFEFYKTYMLSGKPAYSNAFRPTPEEAVEIITEAGGVAVIAHPGRIELEKSAIERLVRRLARCGLKGIEAVYPTHTNVETAYYKELAKELNLFVTGGSDTHYSGGSRRIGSPAFEPDFSLLRALKI